MPRSYSEINLHITWHTKESAPLLTPEIELTVHRSIRKRCLDTPCVYFHEVGGIETHIHTAVSIPPTLTISTFIGQLKGGSSHDINQQLGYKLLDWQSGYGVVSFGTKDLPWVVEYIRNQREHHAGGTTVERLERVTEPDEQSTPP